MVRQKNFADITYLGQVRLLRELAVNAVRRFPIELKRLQFIHHGENTTFQAKAPPVAASICCEFTGPIIILRRLLAKSLHGLNCCETMVLLFRSQLFRIMEKLC